MTEPKPQEQYTAPDGRYPYRVDVDTLSGSGHSVTITISAEWADFLTRAQSAKNDWARHRAVSHIAIVDWRSLGLRVVSLDDR